MDEVDDDIKKYQCWGLSYLPKPKADSADTKFDNSWYNVKTKFNYWFIKHLKAICKKNKTKQNKKSLGVWKSLRMLQGQVAWKLGKLGHNGNFTNHT